MINANRAFKSKISDEDVDLLAENEFHARQSTQDQATLAAADDTPHETMKRRLQDEYEQREVLQNEKVAVEKRLQALQVFLVNRIEAQLWSQCTYMGLLRLQDAPKHVLYLQNENKAKRQKLDSAKSHMEQVAAAAKPAFRNLRLGALDAADSSNTALFPQLPAKLQALYFQIAAATTIASVDAQV